MTVYRHNNGPNPFQAEVWHSGLKKSIYLGHFPTMEAGKAAEREAYESGRVPVSNPKERRRIAVEEFHDMTACGFTTHEALRAIQAAYGVSWRTMIRWGLPVPWSWEKQRKQVSA